MDIYKGEKMEIDDLKIGDLKTLQSMLQGQSSCQDTHWQIGKAYFIRTVTHHYTGRLIAITPKELILEDAAWIADDGRFSDALKSGNLNEVEPFPAGKVIVGRGALLDAHVWEHALPREQK